MHIHYLVLTRLKSYLMNTYQIKRADSDPPNKMADDLIENFLGEKAPTPEEKSPNVLDSTTNETYILPVQIGQNGKSLSEGDKPWIVGHFSPGIATDKNHPKGHNGVDLKAPENASVHPIASGIVKDVGTSNISGNYVMCLHEDGHVQSFYGHLNSIQVQKGQAVTQSTVIGTVGDTGNAKDRGAHLHYEVKVNGSLINPLSIPGKQVGSLTKKASLLLEICKLADKFDLFV